MSAALDPTKSVLIERTGAIVALVVLWLMGLCLVLPYAAVYFHIQIASDVQAALSQIQTTISNVFVAVVSFFFGASAGTRTKDDTIKTLSQTAAQAQNALPPIQGAVPTIPVGEGEKVVVEGKGDGAK